MHLNLNRQNKQHIVLCTNCNQEIALLEYPHHKNKCFFRQTFHNSNRNYIDKENFIISDPNYATLNSIIGMKLDNLEKNKEDNYIRDQGHYNMNDAVVTFGCKNKMKETKGDSKIRNNSEEIISKEKKLIFGIENGLKDNNSFLSVVIQVISAMRKIRKHILRDIIINSKDQKYQILSQLQNVLRNTENLNKGDIISITDLRNSIADAFQSRRKFLINHPDDPADVYFALINSLHSESIKCHLNEIKDTSCDMKCIAHKYLFMDISRRDKCECKGASKRLFSYHNYIFDLPIKRILKKIDLSSSNKEEFSQFKGKLFHIYTDLISNVKPNCPEKGIRCSLNKATIFYHLNSFPEYFVFNLRESQHCRNLFDIFKILIMISKCFFPSTIFYQTKEIKHLKYDLFALVCIGANKNYTSLIKHGSYFLHFEDERINTFKNWADAANFLLKHAEIPLMLFYEKNSNDRNGEEFFYLKSEDIFSMSFYCRNMSNFEGVLENTFRSVEELVKFDDEKSDTNLAYPQGFNYKDEKENRLSPLLQNLKNKLTNQCNVCGMRIIHSTNPNFSCFCDDKKSAENYRNIHNDLSKNSLELKTQIKKNLSNDNIKIEDKHPSINPPQTKSEKDKIQKISGENNIKNNQIKVSNNGLQENKTHSLFTTIESHEFDRREKNRQKAEINLPLQIKDKNILIKDESIKEKSNLPKKENYTEKETVKEQIEEKWVCLVCGLSNSNNNYRCIKCNNNNYDNFGRIIKKNPSRKIENNPIKQDKLIIKNFIERARNLSGKETPKSDKLQISNPNQIQSKDHLIQKKCICHKLSEEKVNTLFNNNICRICRRNRSEIEKNILDQNEVFSGKFKSTELKHHPKLSNENPKKIILGDEKTLVNNYLPHQKNKLNINTKHDPKSFAVINHKEKKKREDSEAFLNKINKEFNHQSNMIAYSNFIRNPNIIISNNQLKLK